MEQVDLEQIRRRREEWEQSLDAHEYQPADEVAYRLILKDLPALLAVVEKMAEALEKLTSEPGDLVYPESDAFGLNDPEDHTAPLWTEGGLYGRVGKDAARTLLKRWRDARAALSLIKSPTRG